MIADVVRFIKAKDMMNYLHYMFYTCKHLLRVVHNFERYRGGGDHLKKQGSIRRKPPSREWVGEMKKAADGCM